MSNAYSKHISTPIPQSKPIDNTQVKNNAGGYVFQVSDKSRLERFLILGSDGPTYYQKAPDLIEGNLTFIVDLIGRDENLVLSTVKEISISGRAYKNSPALFVLALLFKHGSQDIKADLKLAVPAVARTSTMLFELIEYFELLGGWNRSKRGAVASWYVNRTTSKVAYQVVKYRQRNGWTHKDAFRLAHPKGINENVGNFVLGKPFNEGEVPAIITGFQKLQATRTAKDAVKVLSDHVDLPWETLPTELHKSPEVWKKIFHNGQLRGQALLRNITRLARIGAFNDLQFTVEYAKALVNEEMIRDSRLHPINYLNALIVHTEGQIVRNRGTVDYYGYGGRSKDWTTVPQLVDALNEGYYLAFKYIEPTNKRFFLGVDVSGSMSSAIGQGLDITAAQGAGAMAMAIARTEQAYMVRGFTSDSGGWGRRDTKLTDLGITPKMPLNEVFKRVQKSNFGATDCALPMVYAKQQKLEIDAFVVLTDNETWYGDVHPTKALQDYRKASGIDAKLIVVGMTATPFSIADPRDPGMLDVVGLDSNLPKLVSEFAAGRI